MVKTSVWAAVFAGCLFASQAYAQDGGSYSQLSSGGKKIVDAMYDYQNPPEGGTESDKLDKNEIADLKTDSGWGNAFKAMKADGRFEEYKNLGQLISTQNLEARDARKAGSTTEETALTSTKPTRLEKASKEFKRAEKIERTAKIERLEKFDRPDKPDRPEKAERPQRPDRPSRR